VPANVVIRIGAETSQAVSEIGRVNTALGEQMTVGQKAQAGLRKAAVPAAIAFAAVSAAAVDATKAAMEDAAAQSKLEASLGRTTDASQAQIKATADWIDKTTFATGVADDELRPALSRLALATGDLGSAQKELGLALDISAATGKSLDSVTQALAKGYSGQTTALNRLVPGLDQAVLKTKDMTQVNAELARLTGGAAAEAAGTAAGQYQIFTVRMQELKESIGAGLIPVVQVLLPLLNSAAEFASKNTTAIQILMGVVAALSGLILAANAAMKLYAAGQIAIKVATAAWTAAQWLLNAALSANPIGLVIVAVAALAAGIVIAYKESATFRAIVQGAMQGVVAAFNAVLAAASSVFNWIKGHWTIAALALGPVGFAIAQLAAHFDEVKAAASAAFSVVLGVIREVEGAIRGVISAVESLISALGRVHVPSIHIPNPFAAMGPAVVYPYVPALARGGVARELGPTTRSSAAAGGLTVNVYGAVDPEGTARAIRRVLRSSDRRLGLSW